MTDRDQPVEPRDDDTKPNRLAVASRITRGPARKREPVREDQARYFATLIRELIDETRVATELENGHLTLDQFFELPSYIHLVQGAYACGFVCTDMKPDFPLETVNIRPRDSLGAAPFPVLRHYVHMLLRAERWADGYSSPIREALTSGALELVHDRLLNDDNLYHPL